MLQANGESHHQIVNLIFGTTCFLLWGSQRYSHSCHRTCVHVTNWSHRLLIDERLSDYFFVSNKNLALSTRLFAATEVVGLKFDQYYIATETLLVLSETCCTVGVTQRKPTRNTTEGNDVDGHTGDIRYWINCSGFIAVVENISWHRYIKYRYLDLFVTCWKVNRSPPPFEDNVV